jgi:hypothetical protein
MRVLSALLLALFALGCLAMNDPRTRNFVRLEDQVRELEQEINDMQTKGSDQPFHDRHLEARQRRLDSLRTFYERQKQSLESAGINIDQLDRDAVRDELRSMENDAERFAPPRHHFEPQGMDHMNRPSPPEFPGLPEIPRPNMDHHRDFDPETFRREHMERMERMRRDHAEMLRSRNIPVPESAGFDSPAHHGLNAHDEHMLRNIVQRLGFERSQEIINEFAPKSGAEEDPAV